MLAKWDDLPSNMKNASVKKYYDILYKKRFSLLFKRLFDIIFAILSFLIISPIFIILSILIILDSEGPVIFRQVRVTQYGKQFRIFKFRTMVNNAEKIGTQVTTNNDVRITSVGKILRKYRLDEFPQLFNIISGDMSFVGTRPEVVKYVERYTDDMIATLLLPAGVASEASIWFKDEEKILTVVEDVDEMYVEVVLPEKMKYNLKSIEKFNFCSDISILFRTVAAVVKGDNKEFDVNTYQSNSNEVFYID